MEAWIESFEGFRWEAEEFIEVGAAKAQEQEG
jgi:hypothetical protein